MLSILLLTAAASSGCLNESSTTAMSTCLARAAQKEDARLNAAYRAARARVPAAQARALQNAQRAWIAFRDANCRAYAAGEGSITRIETAQCTLDTTAARADELENFAVRS